LSSVELSCAELRLAREWNDHLVDDHDVGNGDAATFFESADQERRVSLGELVGRTIGQGNSHALPVALGRRQIESGLARVLSLSHSKGVARGVVDLHLDLDEAGALDPETNFLGATEVEQVMVELATTVKVVGDFDVEDGLFNQISNRSGGVSQRRVGRSLLGGDSASSFSSPVVLNSTSCPLGARVKDHYCK